MVENTGRFTSEKMKEMWKDKKYRELITNKIKERNNDPEYKKSFIEKMKGRKLRKGIPNKNKKGIIKECVICKNNFYVYPYEKDIKQCCSIKCCNKYKSNIMKGKLPKNINLLMEKGKQYRLTSDIVKNNWKDELYRNKMLEANRKLNYYKNLFRNQIRKRDNQICMLCGIHREKLKKSLSMHHINYDDHLSIPENCISLCNSCHAKTGYNRKYWISFFQNLLSNRYGYHYENNNPIIDLETQTQNNVRRFY